MARANAQLRVREAVDAANLAQRAWRTTRHPAPSVSVLDAAVEHAIRGGTSLALMRPRVRVRVLFDPAGHPFCLFS